MWIEIATGGLAGVFLGYVLQRGQLCFHAMFEGLFSANTRLVRGWILGVAIASVGLALTYRWWPDSGLNTDLAFRPVGNVAGGLLIGIGMVVARSCASGLFYKLGAGMLGAAVGIAGWALGELGASRLDVPGPTILGGGEQATIPGVLDLPRTLVALGFLLLVIGTLWSGRSRAGSEPRGREWRWLQLGAALGTVTIVGWLLAAAGDSSFGPSTVGAVRGLAAGSPMWWLMSFLPGLVLGAHAAARASGTLWVRREPQPVRYLQLASGGFLLGAGGWIAGGCNLGHGLSGAAQLNVSSWVVVAAIVTGVWAGRRVLTASRVNR